MTVVCLLWYNKVVNNTKEYYSPKQGRFPVFISEIINISDSVLVFDHIMEEIEITKYLKSTAYTVGRKGYNSVNMLKTILCDCFSVSSAVNKPAFVDTANHFVARQYLIKIFGCVFCVCLYFNTFVAKFVIHLFKQRSYLRE